MADFTKGLVRNAKELLQLQGAHSDEFLRLLKVTREHLAGRLVAASDSRNPLDAYRVRYIMAETEAAIKQLEGKLKGKWSAAAEEAASLSVEHVSKEIEGLARAFEGTPIDVALGAQKVLADPTQELLSSHYATSVERYGGELLNGVRQRLFTGLRSGDTIGAIVKDIAGQQGPLGTVGRESAERIARTEISQAYNAAHASSFKQVKKEIPDINETWVHIGSYKCDVCEKLHGKPRPESGYWTIKSGKKEKEVAHPPAHPHCVCRIISMRPSWRKGLEKAGYLDVLEEVST